MAEMIEKKALIDDLKAIKEVLVGQGDPILASVLNRAIACVEKQPVVDAVAVVRCKDCRYYNEDGEYCGNWGECRHPEHFCDEGVKEQ